MKHVGILEAGRSPSEAEKFGTSPQRFIDYFSDQPDLIFSAFPVFETGTLPKITECDAFIITGSVHSVYDDLKWIGLLKNFVRKAVAANTPVLGVCFGHQLMAEAFGGRVEKSDNGRGIGVHEHFLTKPGKEVFEGMLSIRLMAAHQDQVIEPPVEGSLLATSSFCKYAAFSYRPSGLSLQGHPEISPDYERHIILKWQKDDPINTEKVEEALHILNSMQSDALKIKPILSRFLTGRLTL